MPVIIIGRGSKNGSGKSAGTPADDNILIIIDGGNIEIYTEDDAVNKSESLALASE